MGERHHSPPARPVAGIATIVVFFVGVALGIAAKVIPESSGRLVAPMVGAAAFVAVLVTWPRLAVALAIEFNKRSKISIPPQLIIPTAMAVFVAVSMTLMFPGLLGSSTKDEPLGPDQKAGAGVMIAVGAGVAFFAFYDKRLGFAHAPHPDEQSRAIREAMDRAPGDHSLDSVVPVFASSAFIEAWTGPAERLKDGRIGLTWAILGPEQTMVYVDRETASFWDRQGICWKQRSMENLARLTESIGKSVFNKAGKDIGLILEHADGLGSSRLLLDGWLDDLYPQGYDVAIPCRSCAIVVPRGLDEDDRKNMLDAVPGMHAAASHPLCDGLIDPGQLVQQEAAPPAGPQDHPPP